MTRVLRGRKGAFLIQMDIGSAANCKQDNIMNPSVEATPPLFGQGASGLSHACGRHMALCGEVRI
jgi:hypothetical protein